MKKIFVLLAITCSMSLGQTGKGVSSLRIAGNPTVLRYIDSTTSTVCYVVKGDVGYVGSNRSNGESVSISCLPLDTLAPKKKPVGKPVVERE
jgi:hypothetical protein